MSDPKSNKGQGRWTTHRRAEIKMYSWGLITETRELVK